MKKKNIHERQENSVLQVNVLVRQPVRVKTVETTENLIYVCKCVVHAVVECVCACRQRRRLAENQSTVISAADSVCMGVGLYAFDSLSNKNRSLTHI